MLLQCCYVVTLETDEVVIGLSKAFSRLHEVHKFMFATGLVS